MSKTILLNQSDWHFTKENPGIPTAVMGVRSGCCGRH